MIIRRKEKSAIFVCSKREIFYICEFHGLVMNRMKIIDRWTFIETGYTIMARKINPLPFIWKERWTRTVTNWLFTFPSTKILSRQIPTVAIFHVISSICHFSWNSLVLETRYEGEIRTGLTYASSYIRCPDLIRKPSFKSSKKFKRLILRITPYSWKYLYHIWQIFPYGKEKFIYLLHWFLFSPQCCDEFLILKFWLTVGFGLKVQENFVKEERCCLTEYDFFLYILFATYIAPLPGRIGKMFSVTVNF